MIKEKNVWAVAEIIPHRFCYARPEEKKESNLKKEKCTCGALHTSNPKYLLDWCDLNNNKGEQ